MTWFGLAHMAPGLVWLLPADTAGPCRTCEEEKAAPSSGSRHDMSNRIELT